MPMNVVVLDFTQGPRPIEAAASQTEEMKCRAHIRSPSSALRRNTTSVPALSEALNVSGRPEGAAPPEMSGLRH